MAVDEALLRLGKGPWIRFYNWDGTVVSFGYFQSLSEVTQRFPDLPMVRRWTGGGAVKHGDDLTFSIVTPSDHPLFRMRPMASYRAIHEAVREALGLPGICFYEGGNQGLGGICFEKPAPNDLLYQGHKICGGAQRRSKSGLLHQGSIYLPAEDENFLERFAEKLGFSKNPQSLPDACQPLVDELVSSRYGNPVWIRSRMA